MAPRRKPPRKRVFGTVRKLPSGRWQARYTGPDGKRYPAPFTFDTRTDADQWIALRQAEVIRNEWNPADEQRPRRGAITLADYAEPWLAERELEIRTREHYSKLLANHIVPAFGDMPLPEITAAEVRTWHRRLASATGPTARAHAYALLRTILNTAVDDELIPANPCRIRGAGQTKAATEIRPATLSELEIIVTTMPDRYQLAVLLAAWCAPRQGELLELRRRDVDLDTAQLRIRHSVARTRTQGRIVKDPKSAAGKRVVSIPPHLLPAIETHLRRFAGPGPDGLLFPGSTATGHLCETTLNDHWYRARAAAGRPDLKWHGLRHTGATFAAGTGAPLKDLMRRLGHSTPAMALRYQHAAQEQDERIAAALSAIATAGNVTPITKRPRKKRPA